MNPSGSGNPTLSIATTALQLAARTAPKRLTSIERRACLKQLKDGGRLRPALAERAIGLSVALREQAGDMKRPFDAAGASLLAPRTYRHPLQTHAVES